MATVVLLDVHATARPVSDTPRSSCNVAVAAVLLPAGIDPTASATRTVCTGGGTTVIDTLPLLPSADAVIVALPTAIPVMSPVPSTVATAASELVQVSARPVSTTLRSSRTTTAAIIERAMLSCALGVVTAIVPTGGDVTVSVALPDTPSAVAAMIAEPAVTPVT